MRAPATYHPTIATAWSIMSRLAVFCRDFSGRSVSNELVVLVELQASRSLPDTLPRPAGRSWGWSWCFPPEGENRHARRYRRLDDLSEQGENLTTSTAVLEKEQFHAGPLKATSSSPTYRGSCWAMQARMRGSPPVYSIYRVAHPQQVAASQLKTHQQPVGLHVPQLVVASALDSQQVPRSQRAGYR
jgi:hypothetical protein